MADWLEALRRACAAPSSQAAIARRLGVSSTMVSLALKGAYIGNLTRLEALVRGTLMSETLICPVLEQITKRRCLDEQTRPFAPTNPQRVQVYKACRICSNRQGK